ncbi:MAG: YtxH domain-containing protein [Acidobacteriota bacterium]
MKESNSKHTDTRSGEESRDTNNKLLYLLVGGGIGAIVALLFAPKQGSQLRGDIAKATRDGYDLTKVKASALKDQSAEVVQNLREKASAAYDYAAAKVSTASDTAADAVTSTGEKVKNAADGTAKDLDNPTSRGGSSQIF